MYPIGWPRVAQRVRLAKLSRARRSGAKRFTGRPDDRFSDEWTLRRQIETVLNLEITPQAKLILIAIVAEIAQPRPTQKTIAAAVGLSPGRVKKILADLRKRRIISARKTGRENVYRGSGGER